MTQDFILIVEDEPDLRDTLEYGLSRSGLHTLSAATGADALAQIRERAPVLVILDLNLPDISGFDVCREIRADKAIYRTPILILTARADEIDRVVAFELGVDDYMTKPFSPRELVLRVEAIMRRSTLDLPNPGSDNHRLQAGPISVDLDRRCGFVDNHEVDLTNIEFELLKTLLRRPGRVQTRPSLLADVWHVTDDNSSRTVDTHVKRLRQKLGSAGDLIRTVRGLGYCLGESRT